MIRKKEKRKRRSRSRSRRRRRKRKRRKKLIGATFSDMLSLTVRNKGESFKVKESGLDSRKINASWVNL